jgi:hypothetical protein
LWAGSAGSRRGQASLCSVCARWQALVRASAVSVISFVSLGPVILVSSANAAMATRARSPRLRACGHRVEAPPGTHRRHRPFGIRNFNPLVFVQAAVKWTKTSSPRHRHSVRPAQPAAVLHYLVRPPASLRAGLAEPQPRRVPCRRPRPVTHMMPGLWAVLVPVTPFPAAISPGELRTAERADVLAGLYGGERIVWHLLDPLRRCWPGLAWRFRRRRSGPAAGCSRSDQPTPRRTHRSLGLRHTRAQTGAGVLSRDPRDGPGRLRTRRRHRGQWPDR